MIADSFNPKSYSEKRKKHRSKISILCLEKKNEDTDINLNQTVIPQEKTVYVTVNFLIIINNIERLFQVNILLSETSLMIELISKAISAFNENSFIFVDNKDTPLFKLSLKEIPSEYSLKPSKKNGKPKDDYPPYCNDSILSNAKRNTFSILFKDDNLILSTTHQRKVNMCPEIGCVIY